MDAGDGVRIVTVHGSKGLQSPVVFLIDTTVTPKVDKFYDIETDNPDYPVWVWTPSKTEEESEEFSELQNLGMRKAIEESFRLLYVAMTRARDELYVYGFTTNKAAPELSWHGMLWDVLSKRDDVYIDEDKIRIDNYGK